MSKLSSESSVTPSVPAAVGSASRTPARRVSRSCVGERDAHRTVAGTDGVTAFRQYCLSKMAFLLLIVAMISACGSPQKTEMRKLVPLETLVYLESNEVADTLETLSASQAFQTLAVKKPDFSALKNVQMAVTITGFETAEENSTLNLKPQFVAVIETHAWHWQTVSLVENQFDAFVKKNYGETARLEKSDKNGGAFYIWTANDDRRVFAFVSDSLIYFGNNAAAIEKCAAVKSGEAENLTKNESFSRAYKGRSMAFGYVSTEGIRQIADLAGVSVAVNASENADGKSFIARIVPPILRNTTDEIVWSANRGERGIKDIYAVRLKPEINTELKSFLNSSENANNDLAEFLPAEIHSATFYNLDDPLIAWRGSLLTTARNVDVLSGKFLIEFSDQLLEPYGINAAETFLSAVDSTILTAQFDAENDRSVTVAAVKDFEKLKTSLSKDINFKSPPDKQFGAEIWSSNDKTLSAAFIENKLILGDGESVLKCLSVKENKLKTPAFQYYAESRNLAVTFGRDSESAAKIVGILGSAKDENRRLATFFTTETRLTESGFERVTVSDFGLIGTILGKLD